MKPRAVARMEKNKPKDEELFRFRAEAAALLGVADRAMPVGRDESPTRPSKP